MEITTSTLDVKFFMHENKTFLTFTYISFFITYMNYCYQEQRTGWESIHCYDHTGFKNPDLIALKHPPGKETQTAKLTGKKTTEYCGYLRKNLFIQINTIYICKYKQCLYLPNQIAEAELLGAITVAMFTHR